jgi:hypothetical protein
MGRLRAGTNVPRFYPNDKATAKIQIQPHYTLPLTTLISRRGAERMNGLVTGRVYCEQVKTLDNIHVRLLVLLGGTMRARLGILNEFLVMYRH